MLLAVEGGGLFSSSATGYSKGLSVLLLAHKNDDNDTPMRVLPWNQYQLVEEDRETDIQLASPKNRVACGCGSFVFFRRASTGLDSSSPLKVGPTRQKETENLSPVSINGNGESKATVEENDSTKSGLRSSLRKHSKSIPRSESTVESEELFENIPDDASQAGRRSIQWSDVCGRELVEIREFEPSEIGRSDDELDYGNGRTCMCRIM